MDFSLITGRYSAEYQLCSYLAVKKINRKAHFFRPSRLLFHCLFYLKDAKVSKDGGSNRKKGGGKGSTWLSLQVSQKLSTSLLKSLILYK